MKQVPKGWECVRGDRGTPGQGRLKRSKNWNHDPPSHLVWDASAFQTSPPPVKITTMIIITMVTTWCIRSSKVPIASSFSLRPASWCWMVEPWLMITWWWEVKINHYKLADYADFDDDQPTDAGMLSLGWRWWWLWWRWYHDTIYPHQSLNWVPTLLFVFLERPDNIIIITINYCPSSSSMKSSPSTSPTSDGVCPLSFFLL